MNELSRRDLLRAFLGTPFLFSACSSQRGQRSLSDISGELVLRREKLGHHMRDLANIPKPSTWTDIEVLVVGGGVAGLSSMRHLQSKDINDTLLLELDANLGGTAQGGQSGVSAHPWGAHYITVPMANNRAFINLLNEVGAVESIRDSGRPVMSEQFLCADPSERLFYRGRWYEGLYPAAGSSPQEIAEKMRFEEEINTWVRFRDAHGRRAFVLPMSMGSDDPRVRELDKVSMMQWLQSHGYKSQRLYWWIEYACRDDYGTSLKDTSAWSVFFYYASRKETPDSDYQSVVTWPEGNAKLVAHMRKSVTSQIRTEHVVVSVENTSGGVEVIALDASNDGEMPTAVGFRAQHVIMATPQFINKHIVRGFSENRIEALGQFQQSPWMVANLHIKERPAGAGFPLCWDNVIYQSPSLGYVVSTHQSGPVRGPTVLTYYYPLIDSDPKVARKRLLSLGWKEWSEVVLSDLERVHPRLRNVVERIDIARWGHGMVRSSPGQVWDGRRELAAQVHGQVHFAHSDLSGVALFEEAFERGILASEQVVEELQKQESKENLGLE